MVRDTLGLSQQESRFTIASCEMGCAVLTIFKPMLQTDLRMIFYWKSSYFRDSYKSQVISWVRVAILIQLDQILKMTTFSWAPVVYIFLIMVGVASFSGIFNFHAPAILRVIARSFFLIKVAVASLCYIFFTKSNE